MKTLLLGGSGQLGKELQRTLSGHQLTVAGRTECDLRSAASIQETLRHVSPQVIVNAAAYTAVDAAETDIENCLAINASAPGAIAQEAVRLGATLVHYSTDYVFDGTKPAPYVESDSVNPLNVYGRSKAAGETAILDSGARAFILRTSWVFSPHGKNFVKTMLRLSQERDRLQIVNDQIGAPTSASALAEATLRIIENEAEGACPAGGVYHLTAKGSASWAHFAREIFARAALKHVPAVEEIGSESFPTPARRPKNSMLSNDKFAAAFGFRLSTWQEQLEETLAALNVRRQAS